MAFSIGSGRVCSKTFVMAQTVGIVGAGVSGLTCAVAFAESGSRGRPSWRKKSAIGPTRRRPPPCGIPYDAGPAGQTIAWALETYRALRRSRADPRAGVSIVRAADLLAHRRNRNSGMGLAARRAPPPLRNSGRVCGRISRWMCQSWTPPSTSITSRAVSAPLVARSPPNRRLTNLEEVDPVVRA